MSNVTDIRNHPSFRSQPNPEDPNHERDEYLKWLDDGELPVSDSHPLDILREARDFVEGKELPDSLSICQNCQWRIDRRPWWKKLLLPRRLEVTDLSCSAFPRTKVLNPVTGRRGYLPEGTTITSHAQEAEPFSRCYTVNPFGKCSQFKP